MEGLAEKDGELLPSGVLHPEETAMSNFLIVKAVFRKLSHEDLLTCSRVNKIWMSVAESMISCYRIAITNTPPVKHRGLGVKKNYEIEVDLEKVDLLTRVITSTKLRSFEDLLEILRGCKKKQQMSIDLHITNRNGGIFLRESDETFWAEFGCRVHTFEYNGYFEPLQEYIRCLSQMPNLEFLKSDKLQLHLYNPESLLIDLTTVQPLYRLKKIHFGENFDSGAKLWEYLLAIAPNVKEIRGFAVQSSRILKRFQKAGAVKSLLGLNPKEAKLLDLTQLNANLTELADLDLNLAFVEVPKCYSVKPRRCRSPLHAGTRECIGFEPWERGIDGAESIKTTFRRILVSSKDSAKVIWVPSTVSEDYYFPVQCRMDSVETLIFDDDWADTDHSEGSRSEPKARERYYFPERTDLKAIFPNLEGIEVRFKENRDILHCFPEDTFGPGMLGHSIKRLKTGPGYSWDFNTFEELSQIFPFAMHLEMGTALDNLTDRFGKIVSCWPNLETLTVNLNGQRGFHTCKNKQSCKFHSGRSCQKSYNRLCENSEMMEKCLTSVEILKFENEFCLYLSELKNLKRLEFILEGQNLHCLHCDGTETHVVSLIHHVFQNYTREPKPNFRGFIRRQRETSFQEISLGEALVETTFFPHENNSRGGSSLPFGENLDQ